MKRLWPAFLFFGLAACTTSTRAPERREPASSKELTRYCPQPSERMSKELALHDYSRAVTKSGGKHHKQLLYGRFLHHSFTIPAKALPVVEAETLKALLLKDCVDPSAQLTDSYLEEVIDRFFDTRITGTNESIGSSQGAYEAGLRLAEGVALSPRGSLSSFYKVAALTNYRVLNSRRVLGDSLSTQIIAALEAKIETELNLRGLRSARFVQYIMSMAPLPSKSRVYDRIIDLVDQAVQSDHRYKGDLLSVEDEQVSLNIFYSMLMRASGRYFDDPDAGHFLKIAALFAKDTTLRRFEMDPPIRSTYARNLGEFARSLISYRHWFKDFFTAEQSQDIIDLILRTRFSDPKYHGSGSLQNGRYLARAEVQSSLISFINQMQVRNRRTTDQILDLLDITANMRGWPSYWHTYWPLDNNGRNYPEPVQMAVLDYVDKMMKGWAQELPGADEIRAKISAIRSTPVVPVFAED